MGTATLSMPATASMPSASSTASMPSAARCLAANVRRLRAERCWNQFELAERCGWSQGRISAIESGRRDRRLGTVDALAAVFGVAPVCLLREPEESSGKDGDSGDASYGSDWRDDED